MLELRSSDNRRHGRFFEQLVHDGVEFKGIIKNEDNIPSLDIQIEGLKSVHFIWFTPQIEQFVLRYMLSGNNHEFPKYLRNGQLPDFRSDDTYIYSRIKRELERGKYTYNEETKDDINGIRVIGQYPYGSLDYGFIPYSWEELNIQLENIEAFEFDYPECDISELHYTSLSIEYRDLAENKKLDTVFDEIPTNTIIDKTICGCGATWLEIHSKRNSIIIEPNVPVIIGKEQKHKDNKDINFIGVHGETIKASDIAEKTQSQTGYVKIMTTPDSFPKVVEALKSITTNYYNDYFLLFDECEKIVSDIDFRYDIDLPINDFFRFQNKAMVSATPIVINDPRFEAQGFKIIKIRPQFDYKRVLELKPTNNVNAMVKKTFNKIDKDSMVCFFYNSVKGIDEIIEFLGLGEQANIFCSTDARKELRKKDYPRVFDTITDKEGNPTLGKYNFFTSRFYSAVDIEIDTKPVVIMITQVYKAIKDKTPYSLIDPETEAIQIAGRFRNGIERLIHITNTKPDFEYYNRDEFEQFLNEQHIGLHKMNALYESVETRGEKHIIHDAIKNTEYWKEHYVDWETGEINYFRYNNAYLDERLKMLYTYPAPLNKAYKRSKALTVISESEYTIYTDEEKQKLKNGSKAERVQLLNDIIKRYHDCVSAFDYQLIQELKLEYSLLTEALMTIGFFKMKELGFKDSDIRTAVNDFNFEKQVKQEQIIEAVYKVFNENKLYPITFIRDQLKAIYNKHNLQLHRKPKGEDITFYFEATNKRTSRERGWELAHRLYKDL